MSNLISSGFSRVFKSKVFYILMICCAIYPIFQFMNDFYYYRQLWLMHANSNSEPIFSLDIDFFFLNDLIFIGVVSSIFVSVFIGKEFSSKTIRNKLIVGHPRFVVYISNLIVCISAVLIIHIVGLVLLFITASAAKLITGVPWILQAAAPEAVKNQILGIFIIASYTAIFLLISMLAGSTSKAAAASLIAAVILLGLGESVAASIMPIDTMLDMDSDWTELGNEEISVDEYNQKYLEELEEKRGSSLTGVQRTVYFFFNDVLPSCQVEDLYQYNSFLYIAPTNTFKYIMCDCGMIIATTALGVFIFGKKDLK